MPLKIEKMETKAIVKILVYMTIFIVILKFYSRISAIVLHTNFEDLDKILDSLVMLLILLFSYLGTLIDKESLDKSGNT